VRPGLAFLLIFIAYFFGAMVGAIAEAALVHCK